MTWDYVSVNDIEPLPPYMQLKLKYAKEDVAAKVGGTYLEKSLDFELFTLKSMFEEAEREQSMKLVTETLRYVQDLLYIADRYTPPKHERGS